MTLPKPDTSEVRTPSLPKGGGAIQSIGTGWGAVGMSGAATFQIPLPISPGRGYTPSLSLDYHSTRGNGPFGMGWTAAAGAIGRSTLKGVPAYNDHDVFIGPSGAELIAQGSTHTVSHYNDLALGTQYLVTRYVPRHETTFDRIEHWSSGADTAGFWLIQAADGSIHLFGKTLSARIADPQAPGRVAQWLLQESLNPHGEQIYYQYKIDTRSQAPRDFSAQRYLSRICYANISAQPHLALWTADTLAQKQWHFELLFDYGERTTAMTQTPTYLEQQPWLERGDPFFSYAYGFELGTQRLCQQILMFHYFAQEPSMGPEPVLTRRLLMEYSTGEGQPGLLQAVHNQACDATNSLSYWPPLELTYSSFTLKTDAAGFQPFAALQGPDNQQRYQLVDLYNDGLPGVLYRNDKSWHYREPRRASQATHADEVVYGPLDELANTPLADASKAFQQSLADLNGDGQLEWIVAQPGMAGFFTLDSNRRWAGFVPFTALPQEFFHPKSQLADLIGNGLHDLALIGSHGVRLYINRGVQGFAPGISVEHQHHDDQLPLRSDSATELVAFSDLLGSGQQHLVRIRHNEIKCWPNLGRGRFGKGFVFAQLPFAYAQFDASRVLLTDLDGSGAADLLYLETDRALIFINRSGNGFHSEPSVLRWPEGIKHDRDCHVTTADLQGLGCSSLILTVNHPTQRHWRYDFVTEKPYLLTTTHNNMGATGKLSYRSSAQEWLDEKRQLSLNNRPQTCGLPFPLHLVSQQQQLDLISGNPSTQRFQYRDGFYDATERKFQGFGLLLETDTEAGHSAALLRKSWFHTGKTLDMPRDGYYTVDAEAHPLGNTLLSQLTRDNTEERVLDTPSASTLNQMRLALSGVRLREELFAAEDPKVPYSVSQQRYQVRQLQTPGSMLVLPLESITYRYEREPSDPACQHTINLRWDRYGSLEHAVTVDYARRKNASDAPPFSEPHQQTWWRDTHDPAQHSFYISETRAQFIHLDAPQRWHLHLPYRQRSNALVLAKNTLSPERLSYEHLIRHGAENPLGPNAQRVLSNQSVQYYCLAQSTSPLPAGQASFQALADHQEIAELDAQALSAYDDVPDMPGAAPFDLNQTLAREHYHRMPLFLPEADSVWSIKQGFARYASAQDFYRAILLRPSESHASTMVKYDRYGCKMASIITGDGCTTQVLHDYRLLLPVHITDAQGNVEQARYDAFGQLQVTSHYGQECGQAQGFMPLSAYQRPTDDSPEAAIANPRTALLNAASACFYAPFSWMGNIEPSPQTDHWIAQGYLLPGGYIRASAHKRAAALDMSDPGNRQLSQQIAKAQREPVHVAVLQAASYPAGAANSADTIRINLVFSDGFGRALQTKQKASPGIAYQVDPAGGLSLDDQGKPLRVASDTRWRVSGKVEYNHKGLAIRQYRPYFADQHRCINDEALRKHGHSDQLLHDPLGRPTSRINARGHLSRHTYCVWYTITEDENDTA